MQIFTNLEVKNMNISEAAEKSGLTAVTLRYYERIGLIPPVTRGKGGVRLYTESDLGWIDFIKCMRNAGLSIESLIEYTTLFNKGLETVAARKEILIEEQKKMQERYNELGKTLETLNKKIEHYEQDHT